MNYLTITNYTVTYRKEYNLNRLLTKNPIFKTIKIILASFSAHIVSGWFFSRTNENYAWKNLKNKDKAGIKNASL